MKVYKLIISLEIVKSIDNIACTFPPIITRYLNGNDHKMETKSISNPTCAKNKRPFIASLIIYAVYTEV